LSRGLGFEKNELIEPKNKKWQMINQDFPVGKIASVFLLNSAMLSKIHSYTDCFFGDFAHWVIVGVYPIFVCGKSMSLTIEGLLRGPGLRDEDLLYI